MFLYCYADKKIVLNAISTIFLYLKSCTSTGGSPSIGPGHSLLGPHTWAGPILSQPVGRRLDPYSWTCLSNSNCRHSGRRGWGKGMFQWLSWRMDNIFRPMQLIFNNCILHKMEASNHWIRTDILFDDFTRRDRCTPHYYVCSNSSTLHWRDWQCQKS